MIHRGQLNEAKCSNFAPLVLLATSCEFLFIYFFCSVPCFGALCKNISQGVKNDCERPPLLDCVQRKTTRQLIFPDIIFPPSNKADVFVTSMKWFIRRHRPSPRVWGRGKKIHSHGVDRMSISRHRDARLKSLNHRSCLTHGSYM